LSSKGDPSSIQFKSKHYLQQVSGFFERKQASIMKFLVKLTVKMKLSNGDLPGDIRSLESYWYF